MKKTWFLAVLTILLGTNAFGKCEPVKCNTSRGNDIINADTLNGATNGAASCYVCEDGYCEDGHVVYKRDFSTFKVCRQGFDDKWVTFTPQLCPGKPNYSQFLNTNGHGLEKIWNVNGIEHKDGQRSGNNTTLFTTGSSICYYYKCIDGLTWNMNQGKCVAGTSEPAPTPQPKQPTSGPVQPAPQPRKTCREQRTTLNGKACCDTLSLGVYKKATDTCECKGEMKFVIENGTGYCRPAEQSVPGVQYNCDTTLLAQIAKWKIACAKNSDIVELINQIETYCKGDNKTEAVFMAFYNTLLGYNPQQCDKTSANITVDMTAQINEVNSAYSQLTAIHNKFRDNVSVWKDAEGNFNTARLASDTVAGVVLGTTGALVTSHVVKKNQVENGFEDIKCTIGGQNVAGWGDQFRVGIQ